MSASSHLSRDTKPEIAEKPPLVLVKEPPTSKLLAKKSALATLTLRRSRATDTLDRGNPLSLLRFRRRWQIAALMLEFSNKQLTLQLPRTIIRLQSKLGIAGHRVDRLDADLFQLILWLPFWLALFVERRPARNASRGQPNEEVLIVGKQVVLLQQVALNYRRHSTKLALGNTEVQLAIHSHDAIHRPPLRIRTPRR